MKLKTVLLAGASLLAMTTHAWSFEMLGSLIISALISVPGGIAILPVASAAAIGQAVVGAALLAANIATAFMQRKPSINPGEFKNTFEDTGNQSEIRAIGRVRVGGLKVFGNTKGLNRYRLIAHTKGLWTATEEHYLGGREVTVEEDGAVSSPPWTRPGGSWVYLRSKIGDGSETAWPQLIAEFPDLWTSDHRARGIFQTLAHYVSPGLDSESRIRKFQLLYQNSEPPYEAVGRAEPVFDPRDNGQSATDPATWQWSMNGVLCACHVLRSFPSISVADIDYTGLAAEATRADQPVATRTGNEARSRASGFWPSEAERGDTMEQVLRSIGAEIVQTDDNRYVIRLIDDARTPDVAFTEKHIVGIEWRSGPESVERPNVCRVRYYSPERNYEMADIDLTGIAWARVQTEIDRVGEQYYDVDLPFCMSASQAQRIGRRLFALARADAGMVTLNMAGLAAWGLSTASIHFPDIEETKTCAIGTPRVDDEAGTVSIPFIVWPDLPEWDPETMEATAPEPIPDMQYPSELDTPPAPVEYAQVVYPDTTREIRIKFTGVTGGTVAEATRRNWSGGNPNPWASMTEYRGLPSGLPPTPSNTWYAYAAANYEGQDADFRVRFFNNDEEGSYWSSSLQARPVAIDNTPVTIFTDDGVYTTDMQLSYWTLERRNPGLPPYTWTVLEQANGRPEVPFEFDAPAPPPAGSYTYRIIAWTSDNTPSTPVEWTVTTPPDGP